MKNRSGTTGPSAPASPDPDNLPLIGTRRPRPPIGWPGGEPDSVRVACDAEFARQAKGGRK
ncbi:hypothetical protein [Streptosporangium sp. NPDC049644]|uniref:hypothetical protein n=1 Tax=Streptosporangium sp. NPDC049644 TaxID=3155507 RepID=UPI003438DC37